MTAVHSARRTRVAALERWWGDSGADVGATVLLDSDYVIRAATPDYTQVARRKLDELMSVGVFDAFPDNPTTPEEHQTVRLAEAVNGVLSTARPQHFAPMRYDIPDPRRHGRFLEKRWMMAVSPVASDEMLGVVIKVHDITLAPSRVVDVLRRYCAALSDGDLTTAAARGRLESLNAYLDLVDEHLRLAAEATGLREALTTRPVIDQAKGLIMADRRCSPDEAFEVLRRLSMETNVRVADVAAALVYQAQRH